ncbi:hypothetical protein CNR22_00230 [Sphingobacteriaceae bacterium]|nr:hypothetical protein CNR22_00230 [Sphingobacteriaceae bacterium]
MCNYKTLAHNENGYIILCNSCNHYRLAFGTTAVSFPPSDFSIFKSQLTYHFNQEKYKTSPAQKCISLDLFCRCTIMVLTYEEFLKLNDLVALASFNEKMETIFEDINLLRE